MNFCVPTIYVTVTSRIEGVFIFKSKTFLNIKRILTKTMKIEFGVIVCTKLLNPYLMRVDFSEI
jgi:hypothetical protein